MSLLVLFALTWIAQESGTSGLIAGFGTGLVVAALRGPKRLFGQMREGLYRDDYNGVQTIGSLRPGRLLPPLRCNV